MGEMSNGRDGKGMRDDNGEIGQVFVSYWAIVIQKNERKLAEKKRGGGGKSRAGELRKLRRDVIKGGPVRLETGGDSMSDQAGKRPQVSPGGKAMQAGDVEDG